MPWPTQGHSWLYWLTLEPTNPAPIWSNANKILIRTDNCSGRCLQTRRHQTVFKNFGCRLDVTSVEKRHLLWKSFFDLWFSYRDKTRGQTGESDGERGGEGEVETSCQSSVSSQAGRLAHPLRYLSSKGSQGMPCFPLMRQIESRRSWGG